MGYRLAVVVMSLVLLSSCAAFDKDEDAIEGFGDKDQQGMPTVVKDQGKYTGYYVGTLVLDDNKCESISDPAGTETKFAIDLSHQDSSGAVAAAIEGLGDGSGSLEGDSTVIAIDIATVRHVFYISFSESETPVQGKCEVIEQDANGQYGEPCANYSFKLEKGEKPAVEEKK